MLLYLARKALILFSSLFCILTITFFLMKAAPGDPFMDEKISLATLRTLKAYYGLDQPLSTQYLQYLKGFFNLEFGRSIVYEGKSVASLVSRSFPISAELGLLSLLFATTGGIALGTWAAMRRASWQDHFAMLLATIGICTPNFVLSSLLQHFVAFKMGLCPIARWGTAAHAILPILALSAMPMAFIARLTRANLIETLQQNYIRAALAKGLPLYRVALFHGLRNAIIPVISYLGPLSAQILTGSFIVEHIFAIPGLGQWFVLSIQHRDYPFIMGLTIFYSILLLTSIFLADLFYSLIDPRIRIKKT